MFGGARWILVEPAGDDALPAIKALLEAPAAGNPVAVVAGALKPASKLLKLALAAPTALAFASYVPDARDAERLVLDMARARGPDRPPRRRPPDRRLLRRQPRVDRPGARQVRPLCRRLAEAPRADRPRRARCDRRGPDEGDLSRLVDSVAGGDAAALEAELRRLHAEGQEGITLIRAMLRRLALLARLRAEVEHGSSARCRHGVNRQVIVLER